MKYSYHIHSNFSDGRPSISEIISYAKELGLDEVGISDHFHLSADRSLIPGDMPLDRLNEYVEEIKNYSFMNKPKIKLGLEVEFVPETVLEVKDLLSAYPFDYLIGSIHIVHNQIIVDSSMKDLSSNLYTDIYREYWVLIEQMAQSQVFDIVGHLDLPKRFGFKPKIDFSHEIDTALKAIKAADMTVELNTSGWFHTCKEQYPSIEFLKKCKELEIPIIVTSDAHHLEYMMRGFDEAYKLLKEIGYLKQAYFDNRKCFFTSLPKTFKGKNV